jgi:quercetin dioxygenase-like cupin family protein
MALNIRRMVTANDSDGKAKVWIDDMASNLANPRPGVNTALIWTTDTMPPDVAGDVDRGALQSARPPGHRGTIFRIIEFGPGNESDNNVTPTIDYALVLKGEIDMDLDDGASVHLTEGDVLVQRATVHNWRNRGTEPCVIAFILIDAQP